MNDFLAELASKILKIKYFNSTGHRQLAKHGEFGTLRRLVPCQAPPPELIFLFMAAGDCVNRDVAYLNLPVESSF